MASTHCPAARHHRALRGRDHRHLLLLPALAIITPSFPRIDARLGRCWPLHAAAAATETANSRRKKGKTGRGMDEAQIRARGGLLWSSGHHERCVAQRHQARLPVRACMHACVFWMMMVSLGFAFPRSDDHDTQIALTTHLRTPTTHATLSRAFYQPVSAPDAP